MRISASQSNFFRLLAATAIGTTCFFLTGQSDARLEPYYILKGNTIGQTNPRILFVLDTSGSMAWKPTTSNSLCSFASCEDGVDSELSRIAAARRAIHQVIEQTQDRAEFALMTFGQERAPSSGGQLPSKCKINKSTYRRFSWSTYYYDPVYGSTRNTNLYGYNGMWRLCGDNRPYPYLRWDNLGVGSKITADDQTSAVPASPLISTTYANFSSTTNASRNVQWFPSFLGVRINLNNDTDPDKDVLYDTYGDYGTTTNAKNSNVWGQDFYYWPYVDGFPGYSFMADYYSYASLGIAWSSGNSGASLYAPFYIDVSPDVLNPNAQGPKTREQALQQVLDLTSPMITGGVDAEGGTPWSSTIGPVISSPPKSNGPFSHSTVASYVAFMKNFSEDELCVPVVTVLVTDGDPSSGEGGWKLHQRLAALRAELNSKVYVVGFTHGSSGLNDMACAGAGSNDDDHPCYGTPTAKWDTCRDPEHPTTSCSYLANDPAELADTLTGIVQANLAMELSSGPGFTANEFASASADPDGSTSGVVKTTISATTAWPGWKAHVRRALCEDKKADGSGQLEDYCQEDEDSPELEYAGELGPCPLSRTWDAGTCLAATAWDKRRLYMNDTNNNVFSILDSNGKASNSFRAALNDAELNIPGAPYTTSQADAVAAFLAGKNWKDGWKLAALAQSAPIVVRRVPKAENGNVPVRDPHCAGRVASEIAIPTSLLKYSEAAWEKKNGVYEDQESVIVGDDIGFIHAIHFDSGNEMWAFMPRFALQNAVRAYAYGTQSYGQPEEVDDHIYGMGGTLNRAWVYDSGNTKWRNVGLIGQGRGGNNLIALDLGHSHPDADGGPVEVLWSTQDPDVREAFGKTLGETWGRPAITYYPVHDQTASEPGAFAVFGSGYPSDPATSSLQGRVMYKVDLVTGEIADVAELPAPTNSTYTTSFGTMGDPTVATHCVSRYWAEAQEAYIADPAGRLFRWDLAADTNHAGDSGSAWNGTAKAAYTFPACKGTGSAACTIAATNKGDPFFFSPAVSGMDRIDSAAGLVGEFPQESRDRFLIALASGSLLDGDTNGEDNDFHSSLYVIFDDHHDDTHGGLAIPNSGGRTAIGEDENFVRLVVSDLTRTRVYRPYDGASLYTDTRQFTKNTRPIRSPRILVSSVEGDDEIEVYDVEYTLFEPSEASCDSRWYDRANNEWHYDQGSTYQVVIRVIRRDQRSIFQMRGVTQVLTGDCEDGTCSPMPGAPSVAPCVQSGTGSASSSEVSVSLGYKVLDGFSPVELELVESEASDQ